MHVVKGKTYGAQRLPIDGGRFVDCTFNQTKLIFKACDTVAFEDCAFKECDWVFEGSALLTLQLLSGLYRGLGDEGTRLVEEIVESVKHGRFGHKLYSPVGAAVA